VSAAALSITATLFTEPADRAKAMEVFGFVAAGGGSLRMLLDGVLTNALSWHWIFLVNVPIGMAVVALARIVLRAGQVSRSSRRVNVAGALAVTSSLIVAVYAIVNGNQLGWTSGRTLGLLADACVLLALFVAIKMRTPAPLVLLRLFRRRN